ncbi:hypothetical protein NDU88_007192 [Pleurodeles waltl]|uniref:Uncharacterized protein n=1 Tax=Pleurodeles waltl TaxID=8319 RepID=A0AAV7NU88_PLEWA|nr:hypothetical protein NDU88_007192 [Pleurodeles waltl]
MHAAPEPPTSKDHQNNIVHVKCFALVQFQTPPRMCSGPQQCTRTDVDSAHPQASAGIRRTPRQPCPRAHGHRGKPPLTGASGPTRWPVGRSLPAPAWPPEGRGGRRGPRLRVRWGLGEDTVPQSQGVGRQPSSPAHTGPSCRARGLLSRLPRLRERPPRVTGLCLLLALCHDPSIILMH